MSAQILLVFRARFLLHQHHILLERYRLAMQPFDRHRFDEPLRFPDVELLLGGIDPAGDPLTGQLAAHIVVLTVDGEPAIGSDHASKGLLIHRHEPPIRIDRRGNTHERRERWASHPRRLVQPLLVVDNSDIFPSGLTVPSDSAYDEETFHATHFKQ
jgi:hypothetical protein